MGDYIGGDIKWDTTSLDYGSYAVSTFCIPDGGCTQPKK